MHHLEIPSPKLTPRRHDVTLLVDAAINHFLRPCLSTPQQKAIEAWHTWFHKWRPNDKAPLPMQKATKLLSDIFFLGQLGTIGFEWDKKLSRPEGEGGQGAYGIAPYYDSHKSTCVIIDPDGHHVERQMPSRKVAVLSSLLHECCHAFIYKYACIEECGAEECSDQTIPTIGTTGHASAWFLLAAFAQTFARRHLHPEISLEIFHNLLLEHDRSGQLPEKQEWFMLEQRLSVIEFGDLSSELQHAKA